MRTHRRHRKGLAALGLLLAFAAPAAAAPPDAREAVQDWLARRERAVVSELVELLAIPNLAADSANIRRNAEAILAMLARRGFRARLLDGEGGPPAVWGELAAPGATRTVTVYAHYDGQPVDPARWASPPWKPVLRDGPLEAGGREIAWDALPPGRLNPEWRLYARSAGDDKAPIVALLAALDALSARGMRPSVHLEVFFEGEEEAGSDHLEAVLRKNAEILRSDLWLLCDGPVHASRRPQLFFGARGVMGLEATVYGATRTLHSGHYGNWAPNPALRLSHLVAGLRDPDGTIRIEGFSEDVRPLGEAEKRALAQLPDVDDALRRELAIAETEAGGARLAERILIPALNVRGLESGGVGERAANAIPTTARASFDFRLVPDQKPARVREKTEAHLRRLGWHVVHAEPDAKTLAAHPRVVRLVWEEGYPAARTDMDSPEARALVAALESGGRTYLRVPSLGGSIPMERFQRILGVPVIGLPIANPDNNQHAADENLRLGNLWEGIEAFAVMLDALGPRLR